MRRLMCILFLLLAPASAAAGGCGLEPTETVRIKGLSDGETLVLEDGREVRLLNMLSPRRPLWLKEGRDWPAALHAERELAALAVGREAGLAFDERAHDRHGRLLAHVFVDGAAGKERIWLQGEMVARGRARAWSLPSARACVKALLGLEAAARQKGSGLWGLDFYKVRQAVPAEPLKKLKNAFALVEGKVLKVAKVGARTFINFEADWRRDFTLVVDGRAAAAFAAAAIDPASWQGRRIRARGWVENYNGPMIKVTHPEQVEGLDE